MADAKLSNGISIKSKVLFIKMLLKGYCLFVVDSMSMSNFLAVPYIDSRMPDVI